MKYAWIARQKGYALKEMCRVLDVSVSGFRAWARGGNCWDNAPTESWFNSFKSERIHGTRFASHRQMEAEMGIQYLGQ